jgi:hypothetical protein
MKSLKFPELVLQSNINMDSKQRAMAAAFVDKLLELKVLGLLKNKDMNILLNALPFVVPKEGQEGKWQVIADMLHGSQNMYIGNNPILPWIYHVLDLMYEYGYSAVIDAMQLFYQFPTHSEDRKYLGLLHPVTNILHAYRGLQMEQEPVQGLHAIIDWHFLHALKAKFDMFEGKGKANCWWTGFTDLGFDPEKGYGFTLHSADGPAVLL